ncbi:MAG: WecB/TagA/CpsF family glycosyltransferase [Proteobacteria bacterium]|nr:WecB/TagA/CpsF family glycosyltransferase [Pseudomonadota bacterium]
MTINHYMKIIILIRRLHIVYNDSELKQLLDSLRIQKLSKPVRIAFVNAHGFNMCYKDATFLNDLLDCDYIFRDGSGIKLLFKVLGKDAGLNLNGTDLIPKIIKEYKGYEIALLGTEKKYLDKSSAKINDMGVKTSLMIDGFKDDCTYQKAIRKSHPQLVILAMGMPKQERVARLLSKTEAPCLIICGGAILDFIGGKVTRAPIIFRKYGMEWLFRLMMEPRRLFKRYIIGNFMMIIRAIKISFIYKRL